jgi:hypothetical protein
MRIPWRGARVDRTPTLGDLCDCRLGIRVFENVHCFEGPERDDLFARGGREGIPHAQSCEYTM